MIRNNIAVPAWLRALMCKQAVRIGLPLLLTMAALHVTADPVVSVAGPKGVWVGQDGHDFTSPAPVLQSNDVQDVHLVVMGLPTERRIVTAKLIGYGGGEWNYNGSQGSWKIKMDRDTGSANADFYFDPGTFDTLRQWNLDITFDNGEKTNVSFAGAHTDPNRRMPNASLKAVWLGQDGADRTGRGPAVGPDGHQDIHIRLSHLSPKVAIESLEVSVRDSQRGGMSHAVIGSSKLPPHDVEWSYGLNRSGVWNAEVIRHADDPSQADLYFSPDRDLIGKSLQLRLTYVPGQGDMTTVVAGHTDPLLPVPMPMILEVTHARLPVIWKAQDGEGSHRGDIHVRIEGLSGGKLTAVALSDSVGGIWTYTSGVAPPLYVPPAGEEIQPPLPLDLRTARGSHTADLFFPPFRNEASTRMTLRLIYAEGPSVVTQFAGGECDPYLRGIAPDSSRVVAHPGEDLNVLANRYGMVRLSPGTYRLNRALELNHSVTISGEPGAIVAFSQSPGDRNLWQTAVKIGCGNTTLEGFAIRFATPIHWQAEDYINGAAVLGTVKQTPGHEDPGCNIVVANMDIESSPLAPGAPPDDPAWAIPLANGGKVPSTPRLMRFLWATSGKITNNILRGGTCDVMQGPWVIANNDYRGTTPGAFTYDVFAAHYCHDVSVLHNRIHVVGASGKTWRFLTMTQAGDHDIIQDNDVQDIGIHDTDTVPNPNAPEILLTEAYRLHFEGIPAFLSSHGMVIGIPALQGSPVRAGNVVSILNGPQAGKYFRIAQAIAPTIFLMDTPLPAGHYDVSIATGFVEEDYERNTIDMRGSSASADFVLAGNQYGPRIIGNHMLGGNDSLILSATPTESPNIWGWSHAPLLGAVVEDNTFEDAVRGGTLHVEHNPRYIKSNSDRVYMTAELRNNKVRWSDDFFAGRIEKTARDTGYIKLGDPNGMDPSEFLAQVFDNQILSSRIYPDVKALKVISARVNGKDVVAPSIKSESTPH